MVKWRARPHPPNQVPDPWRGKCLERQTDPHIHESEKDQGESHTAPLGVCIGPERGGPHL